MSKIANPRWVVIITSLVDVGRRLLRLIYPMTLSSCHCIDISFPHFHSILYPQSRQDTSTHRRIHDSDLYLYSHFCSPQSTDYLRNHCLRFLVRLLFFYSIVRLLRDGPVPRLTNLVNVAIISLYLYTYTNNSE